MYDITTGTTAYDLMWLMDQAFETTNRALARQCHQAGVSVAAAQVLYIIEGLGRPVSAYFVAGVVGKQHHSVVELVNRLAKKGYLERIAIPGETSKTGLALTVEGKDILAKFTGAGTMDDLVKQMDKTSLSKLMEGLRALREVGMKEIGELHKGEIKLWE